MTLSSNQRFQPIVSNGHVYAPLTHGCPANIYRTDYGVFKKTLQEKFSAYGFKKELGKTKNHKFITQFKGSF